MRRAMSRPSSTSASATTADTIAPTTPAGLVATAAGATTINLTWSASTDNVGVTGYIVKRNGVQVGTPTTPSYADTGLSAATTYSYTVAARDAAGNVSPDSASASATTADTIAALDAHRPGGDGGRGDDDQPDVDCVHRQRRGDRLYRQTQRHPGGDPDHPELFGYGIVCRDDVQLHRDGARCGGQCLASSTSVSATTADTIAPSTPTGLVATAAGATTINLTWSASTDNVGVTGYIVKRNGVQVGTPTTPSYSDTGLSVATTYTYTVAARDAAGNVSPDSTSASATTADTIAPSTPDRPGGDAQPGRRRST